MTRLIFFGVSAAVPDDTHQNTHLALVGRERLALIDCTGTPILSAARLGIDLPQRLTDLVLTHFHPDHVGGAPTLLMQSWLLGRKAPLPVYGLAHTMERVEQMMALYAWEKWPGFYPVTFHSVPEQAMSVIIDCPEFRISGSPVRHLLPTLGLRIDFPNGQSLAYSCDTAPCQAVTRLAQEVDVLIHEASGHSEGHSSAAQAGEIAQQAGAKSIYLVHYSPQLTTPTGLIEQARSRYSGPVQVAQDMMEIEFAD